MLANIISKELGFAPDKVNKTIALLDDGATIPFIARYRKEVTGSMDEVAIGNIKELYEKLKAVVQRKETIIVTIEEQGKLTPELKKRIDNCFDAVELEDIYLPYKPKRRTRATMAKERGLEPLADYIYMQQGGDVKGIEVGGHGGGNARGLTGDGAIGDHTRDIPHIVGDRDASARRQKVLDLLTAKRSEGDLKDRAAHTPIRHHTDRIVKVLFHLALVENVEAVKAAGHTKLRRGGDGGGNEVGFTRGTAGKHIRLNGGVRIEHKAGYILNACGIVPLLADGAAKERGISAQGDR